MKTPRGRFRENVLIKAHDPNRALLRIETDDDGTGFFDGFIFAGPNDEQFYSVDTAGEMSVTARDQYAVPLSLFMSTNSATDNHAFQISGANPVGILFDVENDGRVSVGSNTRPAGLRLAGPTSVPADAEINNGEIMFWVDPTNGAMKLKFKGKQANGTVRTGEVALA